MREYIVAPAQPLPLDEVLPFLEGLQEGIQSRYSVQQRAYPFPVRRTQLLVYELFQAVRLKRGQLKTVLLHTDPLGTPFPKIRDELMRAMEGAKEVVILAGARDRDTTVLGHLLNDGLRALDFYNDFRTGVLLQDFTAEQNHQLV
ncbi:MAG: hypothetical protein IMHGJWDQ_002120, partial [Candidatus Fervidibacter sp.]